MLDSGGAIRGGSYEAERSLHKRGELFVNLKGAEGGLGETVGGKGNMKGPTS